MASRPIGSVRANIEADADDFRSEIRAVIKDAKQAESVVAEFNRVLEGSGVPEELLKRQARASAQAQAEIRKLGQAERERARQTRRDLSEINREMETFNSRIRTTALAFGIGAAYTGVSLFRQYIGTASEFEQGLAQLRLIETGSRQAIDILTDLQRVSADTGVEIDILSNFLTKATQSYGEYDRALFVTQRLAEEFRQSATDNIRATQAFIQLAQGVGGITIQMQELRAATEAAPSLFLALRDEAHRLDTTLRDLADRSAITREFLFNALRNDAVKTRQDLERMGVTFVLASNRAIVSLKALIGRTTQQSGAMRELVNLVTEFDTFLRSTEAEEIADRIALSVVSIARAVQDTLPYLVRIVDLLTVVDNLSFVLPLGLAAGSIRLIARGVGRLRGANKLVRNTRDELFEVRKQAMGLGKDVDNNVLPAFTRARVELQALNRASSLGGRGLIGIGAGGALGGLALGDAFDRFFEDVQAESEETEKAVGDILNATPEKLSAAKVAGQKTGKEFADAFLESLRPIQTAIGDAILGREEELSRVRIQARTPEGPERDAQLLRLGIRQRQERSYRDLIAVQRQIIALADQSGKLQERITALQVSDEDRDFLRGFERLQTDIKAAEAEFNRFGEVVASLVKEGETEQQAISRLSQSLFSVGSSKALRDAITNRILIGKDIEVLRGILTRDNDRYLALKQVMETNARSGNDLFNTQAAVDAALAELRPQLDRDEFSQLVGELSAARGHTLQEFTAFAESSRLTAEEAERARKFYEKAAEEFSNLPGLLNQISQNTQVRNILDAFDTADQSVAIRNARDLASARDRLFRASVELSGGEEQLSARQRARLIIAGQLSRAEGELAVARIRGDGDAILQADKLVELYRKRLSLTGEYAQTLIQALGLEDKQAERIKALENATDAWADAGRRATDILFDAFAALVTEGGKASDILDQLRRSFQRFLVRDLILGNVRDALFPSLSGGVSRGGLSRGVSAAPTSEDRLSTGALPSRTPAGGGGGVSITTNVTLSGQNNITRGDLDQALDQNNRNILIHLRQNRD